MAVSRETRSPRPCFGFARQTRNPPVLSFLARKSNQFVQVPSERKKGERDRATNFNERSARVIKIRISREWEKVSSIGA